MTGTPELCANCKTERYGIYRRQYCYRCYPLILQKEHVVRWDLKDRSTLKSFPTSGGYSSQRGFEEAFPKIKAQRLRELEYRLWLLKVREAQRSEQVDGLDIEHQIRK